MSPTKWAGAVAVVFAVACGSPARAAFTVYTDRSTFLAAVEPGFYLEMFNALESLGGGGPIVPLVNSRTFFDPLSGFGFTAMAPPGLDVGAALVNGDPALSINGGNTITFTNFVGPPDRPPTAVGGFFFARTGNTVDPNNTLLVTVMDVNGLTATRLLQAPTSRTSFAGFTSDGPRITQLTVTRTAGSGLPATDDFIVGRAAAVVPVPVPPTLLAGAVGLLGLALARRRRPAG